MKLWKTTLVVLTDYDPSNLPSSNLMYESIEGDSFPYSRTTKKVGSKDISEEALQFFCGLDESDG